MKRIAILGPTGMLGSAVYGVLREHHEVTLVYRDEGKLDLLGKPLGESRPARRARFDARRLWEESCAGFDQVSLAPELAGLSRELGDVDLVVNCVGAIKPHSLKDPAFTLFLNGVFPHLLSRVFGERLLHITTDCVFSGIDGGAPYTEASAPTPNDLYGLSKSIGEPTGESLVLRTSIIGPEISGFLSLVEWVRKQDGQKIRGFTRHLWNGITTKQFGKIVDRIVRDRSSFPKNGLFHVFSNVVTKYDMVRAIAAKYGVNAQIEQDDGPRLDRTLASVHDVCHLLEIPSFTEMLSEM
jgi:dTDP-4-dehydrorhamnose reductase